MKTLKEAVEEAIKERSTAKHKDSENFRLMFAALALPPKDLASGTKNDFLGDNGIKLCYDVDEGNRSISLRLHGSSKIHTLTVECMPTGFKLSNEGEATEWLTLDDALSKIANWYLNLVEKYS